MKKVKRLCSKISKEQNKLFLVLIIGYVILFCMDYFLELSSTFVFIVTIFLFVMHNMFINLKKYDTETIMKNNFLYILLSITCLIFCIIFYSILFVGIIVFNIENIWLTLLLALIDSIISLILTIKINKHFKKKIKTNDSTSD